MIVVLIDYFSKWKVEDKKSGSHFYTWAAADAAAAAVRWDKYVSLRVQFKKATYNQIILRRYYGIIQ